MQHLKSATLKNNEGIVVIWDSGNRFRSSTLLVFHYEF